MNNAPPVVFPVGRFILGPMVLLFLALSSAVGLFFWQRQAEAGPTLWVWTGWCCCSLAAVFAWTQERLTKGSLVWSGDAWWWRDSAGRDFEIQIHLLADVDAAVWVSFQTIPASAGLKTRFAWMDSREMPALWHGFRCAVYSRPDKKHKNSTYVRGGG